MDDQEPLVRHPSLDDRWDPAIRIVPYDTSWPRKAAVEMRLLRVELGSAVHRVDHIGSTAVPGLAAKPVIDLQASVQALAARTAYVGPLQRLGYLFAPAPESPDRHFFAKPPERPREYHLHVCQHGATKSTGTSRSATSCERVPIRSPHMPP